MVTGFNNRIKHGRMFDPRITEALFWSRYRIYATKRSEYYFYPRIVGSNTKRSRDVVEIRNYYEQFDDGALLTQFLSDNFG